MLNRVLVLTRDIAFERNLSCLLAQLGHEVVSLRDEEDLPVQADSHFDAIICHLPSYSQESLVRLACTDIARKAPRIFVFRDGGFLMQELEAVSVGDDCRLVRLFG